MKYHYKDEDQGIYRVVRSAKHRYIYFCTNNKKLKKEWTNLLQYKIKPYPKGDNSNYILGDYLKPKIIQTK